MTVGILLLSLFTTFKHVSCLARHYFTNARKMVYIYNFCVEVFEKTISRTEMIDHSFES